MFGRHPLRAEYHPQPLVERQKGRLTLSRTLAIFFSTYSLRGSVTSTLFPVTRIGALLLVASATACRVSIPRYGGCCSELPDRFLCRLESR